MTPLEIGQITTIIGILDIGASLCLSIYEAKTTDASVGVFFLGVLTVIIGALIMLSQTL